MTLRFISDLHLDESRPDLAQGFFDYLEKLPADTEALYILGDFFEAWVGDDDDLPFHLNVKQRLKALTEKGIALYFMHGNRDFMIGEQFAEETGGKLLEEGSIINHGDQQYLLMHGDSLCIDDEEYQAFRAQIRNPATIQLLMSQSLDERRTLAKSLRENSQSQNSNKAEDIMDVNQQEVERIMQDNAVSLLIHGHTHRPAIHEFALNDSTAKRVVLGDWHDTGWEVTVTDDNEISLNEFRLAH
ncbi:UDP-2,3-diacylglucosamine hydrolase [BD1-7 clade bacterium]|uniref:UDP-2,3-diacylglucosamine hydrolase n=1 Tax=BD1-7 clade bacterium TaxID=2029982 RepID=A0A5S9QG77_9GAMM|nr:UDP-2,3-diacylglucosamine hydrolase [BD1-7 clade bacterium]CAA0117068.1 UDP-2,3-diacylglucosamine hydrolase [BD1-7 clade bacterium]